MGGSDEFGRFFRLTRLSALLDLTGSDARPHFFKAWQVCQVCQYKQLSSGFCHTFVT